MLENDVVYLGYHLGCHVEKTLDVVRGLVTKTEDGISTLAPLRFSQKAWAWDLHARSRAEFPSAVMPPVTADEDKAFEGLQRRALQAQLGGAAGRNASSALLRAVFGRWRLKDRRLVSRLTYLRTLGLACEKKRNVSRSCAPLFAWRAQNRRSPSARQLARSSTRFIKWACQSSRHSKRRAT